MGYADPEKQREYMRIRARRPDVRAANNASNREASKRIRAWFAQYKATVACEDCGDTRPVVLEFHHRDPSTKLFTIGSGLGRVSLRKLKAELAKCVVLCANCHLVRHAEMRVHTRLELE